MRLEGALSVILPIQQEREELPADAAGVRRVNELAFAGLTEARIVDELRASCPGLICLVAAERENIVGHILFSPVVIEARGGDLHGMGLGPMAVIPDHQRQGIGSALVRFGLEKLMSPSCPFVIVLGHPAYYPRFGFVKASVHGVQCQWEGVPDEAFMVLVLDQEVLSRLTGTAKYRQEFEH